MKYTPATFAKAIVAFVTAFGGAAATSAPHDALGWAGCLGAGLVAFAAVFSTPNKANTGTADVAIDAIQATVQQAQSAANDVARVKDAVAAAVQDVPVLGPLAKQAIDRL